MFNFNSWRHRRTLIYHLKGFITPQTSQSLNPSPLFHHFCTNPSDSTSFAASYLIHNFGFDPQFASKLCSTHRLRFNSTQKPESVVTFFRNYGFSDSQLRDLIAKMPGLLSCKPFKTVLPKFQFFLSKGASNSDIVNLVCKNPVFLTASLDKKIVQTYELVCRFLQSDKETLALLNYNANLLCDPYVRNNITMLIEKWSVPLKHEKIG
ncbi:putative transcription regulator mTERF family [Medicago truncatula]|uniref:Putative transcription regulator mTERF family n=1 Tax=Medicago truncatula TaxID=3880 RepID=A0A072V5C5_MEDTR|nr:uncharacterized protein LOC25488102 [Medicago truncatula]KEH37229.1 mTERF protein [Medicago truncatula]RHN73179.1 putative transcription regulator mTERF family [Medicago truncatula]